MGQRNRKLAKFYLAIVTLVIMSINCNMPGREENPTPTEKPSGEIILKTQEEVHPTPTLESTVQPTAIAPIPNEPEALPCAPLPNQNENVITVSDESNLRDLAYGADSGTTILIEPGLYTLDDTIQIVNDGITLRSSTGNREDVILDGGGMLTGLTHVILIEADDVTIADITIRNAGEHGISINGSDYPVLYNLHIYDSGSQLVKVNPGGDGSHNGSLACSKLEYTISAPDEYTNGISAHDAHDWTVRDNQWYRIRTPGNSPVPTILFWSGSTNTIVERNLLVDCYQGIAFGNSSHEAGDHIGGIVRNNFIYASLPHDSVIEMVHATGWVVANNTALLLNPDGITWGIEARYADTNGEFLYNLTNMEIWDDRDGAQTTSVGNMTDLTVEWLRNPSEGDLHLKSVDLPPVNAALLLPIVPQDYDGDIRPMFDLPDVGADEFSPFTVFIPSIIR
jgi:hypothetical protein